MKLMAVSLPARTTGLRCALTAARRLFFPRDGCERDGLKNYYTRI
jgi:hypothetical protein